MGTSITILPQKIALGLHLNPTPIKLSEANGRDIECFGKTLAVISIPGQHHSYTLTRVVVNTVNPLQGADFLHNYGQILNCCNGKLIDEMTCQFIQGGRVTTQIQSITVNDHTNQPEAVQSLLQEFLKLIRPWMELPLVPNMKVTHVIDIGDSAPTYAKVRQQREIQISKTGVHSTPASWNN